MPLKIFDTVAPQGDYPAVLSEHVQMPDGSRLSDLKIEAAGLPTFDLVAIGLPTVPMTGEIAAVQCDTTEIRTALDKGLVVFRLNVDRDGRSVAYSIPVVGVLSGAAYACTYTTDAMGTACYITVIVTEGGVGVTIKTLTAYMEEAPGSGINTTTIMEDQTISGFTMDESYGMYAGEVYDLAFTLNVGETYRVSWNGVDYVCVAGDASDVVVAGAVYLGNGSIAGLSGNGEPFVVVIYGTTMMIFVIDSEDSRDSHTIGIYQDDIGVTETYIKHYVGQYINEALGGDY